MQSYTQKHKYIIEKGENNNKKFANDVFYQIVCITYKKCTILESSCTFLFLFSILNAFIYPIKLVLRDFLDSNIFLHLFMIAIILNNFFLYSYITQLYKSLLLPGKKKRKKKKLSAIYARSIGHAGIQSSFFFFI